jgi:hypothetical protein
VYGIVWLEWSPRNIWIGHDGVVYLFYSSFSMCDFSRPTPGSSSGWKIAQALAFTFLSQ